MPRKVLTKPPPNRWTRAELEVMLDCLASQVFMQTHAPSFEVGTFPAMTVREASTKASMQHLLCVAIAKEIQSRAGEHNNHNLRPFASIATKIAAARQEKAELSPQEGFQAFDLDAFMQSTPSAGKPDAGSKLSDPSASTAGSEHEQKDDDQEPGQQEEEGGGGEVGGGEEEEAGPEEEEQPPQHLREERTGKQDDDRLGHGEGGHTDERREEPATGGASEYDDRYVPPIRDEKNITFQTRILNQHLVCTLCMGYFKDACTIIECLHTFCRGVPFSPNPCRCTVKNTKMVRLLP